MKTQKEIIAQLALQTKKGNKKAFEELYKLTSPKAYFVALEFTKNEQDAEDILQESYITALSKISSLENEEKFQSWINQIVANKSKDFLKRKKPSVFADDCKEVLEAMPEESEEFNPESSVDRNELRETVMEVVDGLSEDKRACVMMMYFEQMSVKEISNVLEISISAVKSRLLSARSILKQGFEKRGITAAYSATPFGLAAWAINQTAEAVSQTFEGSASAAKILSGITVAGTATAAASGAAGAGIAAKAAATITLQKIAASVAVVGVVTGSTVGITAAVKNRKKSDDIPQTAYSDTVIEATSGAPDIIEAVAPVQIVEKDEENPKHDDVYIQEIMNLAVKKAVYAGTAKEGTNVIKLNEKTESLYCDFYANETGYYLVYYNNNENAALRTAINAHDLESSFYTNDADKALNLPWTQYAEYPAENNVTCISTVTAVSSYRTDYPKMLCYMAEGYNYIITTSDEEIDGVELVVEYYGKEISDVEFLNNSLENRILGYNLNAPYVTTYNDSYHINSFDVSIKFSSEKELFMGSTELGYYVDGGVKEGENNAVFLFPAQNVEKKLVAHEMTDYVKAIEIDELDDFLKFEINENGFDLNKPEEYTVTVTYSDGKTETFNGADWDKNITLENGTVLLVEFKQPKLTDREAVQFIVAVGDEEYIRENCQLTGVDPIGFTKKVIVFSADVLDYYNEMIADSHKNLFEKTESFDDFKAYFSDAIEITAYNSYAGTKRVFGYGLDLFITLIKIAAKNIIVL